MTTHLIHVGNSLAVRIPKTIIAQVGFTKETNLVFKITPQGLLISPIRKSREGWSESYKSGCEEDPDSHLMGENILNQFDQDQWEW